MATVIYKERRKNQLGSALQQASEAIAKSMYAQKEREFQQEQQEDRQKHQFDYLKKQSELNLANTMTANRYKQNVKNIQNTRDGLVYDFFATHTEQGKYGPKLSAKSATEWAKVSAPLMAGASNDARKFAENRLGEFDKTLQTENIVAGNVRAFTAAGGPENLKYMINENPESVKATLDLYFGKDGMLSRGVDEVLAMVELGHIPFETLRDSSTAGSMQFKHATANAAGGVGVPMAAIVKDDRFKDLANLHRWYSGKLSGIDRQLITAEGEEKADQEQLRSIYVGMQSMSMPKELTEGIIKEYKDGKTQEDLARFFKLKANNDYIPETLRDKLARTETGRQLVDTYIEKQAKDNQLIADAGDLAELKEKFLNVDYEPESDPLYLRVKQHSGAQNYLATSAMAKILMSESDLFNSEIAPMFASAENPNEAFMAYAMQEFAGPGGADLLRKTYEDKFNQTVAGKLMKIVENQLVGKEADPDDWNIIQGVYANRSLSQYMPVVKDIMARAQDPFKTITVGDTSITAKQSNLPALIEANVKLGKFTADELSRNAAVILTMDAMGQLDLTPAERDSKMQLLKGEALGSVTKLYQDGAARQLAIGEGRAKGLITDEEIRLGMFNMADPNSVIETIKSRQQKQQGESDQAVFNMPVSGPLSKMQQATLALASPDVQKAFWEKRTGVEAILEQRRYDDYLVDRENTERLNVLTSLRLVNPAVKQNNTFLLALSKNKELAGKFVSEALQEQTEAGTSFALKTKTKYQQMLLKDTVENFYAVTGTTQLDLTPSTSPTGEFVVTNNATNKALTPNQLDSLGELTSQVMSRQNWIDAHQGLIRGQGGAIVDKNTMWTGTARDTNTVVAGLSQEMWNTALQEGMIPDWSAILTQSNQIALQVMSSLKGGNISKFSQVIENPKYEEAIRASKQYVLESAPFVRHGIKYSENATFIPDSIRAPDLDKTIQQRVDFASKAPVNKVLVQHKDLYNKLFDSEDPGVVIGKMINYDVGEEFDPNMAIMLIDGLQDMVKGVDEQSDQKYQSSVQNGFNLGMFGTGLSYAAQNGTINPNAPLRASRSTWNDAIRAKWEEIVTTGSNTREHDNELKYLLHATQELAKKAMNNG